MTPVVQPVPRAEAPGALPSLQVLCRDLRAHGCTALVVQYSNCGDADTRVQISCGVGPVVELLWPSHGARDTDWWHAVRIDPDHRSIWCGPPKNCGSQRLIGFLEDVLLQPPETLTGRYQVL
jgi:hypothetical protein